MSIRVNNLPRSSLPEKFRHKRGVKNVAALVRDDATQYRHSQQCKIAYDVQNLVAHELVLESQSGLVQHSVWREHDCVIKRASANQVGAAQCFYLFRESKCASGSYLATKCSVRHTDAKLLHAYHRVWEINQTIYLVRIRRLYADSSIALNDFDLLAHHQRTARDRLLNDACAFNHLCESFSRAVHDWDFKVVNFYECI